MTTASVQPRGHFGCQCLPLVFVLWGAILTSAQAQTLAEALDAPDWRWSTGGTGGFLAQNAVSHDGNDAAQAGPLRSGIVAQLRLLETELVGPGVLTFWWLVAVDDDSPQGADFSLELKVGSNVVERLSEAAFGSGATWFWLNRECQLPAGEQTVSWRFATLGGCTDPASGTLWLDEVGFHRAGSLQVVGTSGGRVNLDLWGSPGSRYELQFSENLEDWSAAAGSSRVTLEGGSVRLDLESAGRCGFFRAVPVGS